MSRSRSNIIVIAIAIVIVIIILIVFVFIVIVMNQYQQQVSWLVDLLIQPAVWDHTASISCSKPPHNLRTKLKPRSYYRF